jgi:hypothetical protein
VKRPTIAAAAPAVVSWFRDDVLGRFVAGLLVAGTVWLVALIVPAIRERTADLFNSQVRVWQVVAVVVPAVLLLALGTRAVAVRHRKKLSTASLLERIEHAGALWTVHRAWYVGSHRAAVFGPFCPDDGTFLSRKIANRRVAHGEPHRPQPWEHVGANATFSCTKCRKVVRFKSDMRDVYSIVRNIGVAMPVQRK